ncbi:hypothetical protein NQ315_001013 [Exocentrus adspersus]|uniref:CCDC66 domain-containing protein n=1 Tax=Exocentrus adspersus TaxID=1586481 RepID=A0AAV8WET5_9CUCU|nr:hypothetical protein NQ315_001013 [Exocentrus adspersus]
MVHPNCPKRECKESTRRGSLPPLYKNQYNSYDRYEREKELGAETTGRNGATKVSGWGSSGSPKKSGLIRTTTNPPNWVKRGLQDGEIVVSNTSPAESPEQRYEEQERPCTGSSYSHQQRTSYIRGQNIPIDAVELAERERRRQVAMAHQEAIRQQLEDRERRRREEREKRIKEEREEELRIEREQEIERQRKENELRILREKQERERRRKEAIQEAIALAQKAAETERARRLCKQTSNHKNITENVIDKDKTIEENAPPKENNDTKDNHNEEEKKNNCDQLNNTRNITPRNEILNNGINNLEIKGKGVESPRCSKENVTDKPPTPAPATKETTNVQSYNILNNALPPAHLYTPRADNLALVIQTPLEAIQTIQYAVLVPTTPQTIPIAVPVTTTVPQIDRSCNTSRTENRILTPTQYRNKNKLIKKLSNIELTYDNRNRKGRRSRSESLEERPKWNANRPPTRYLKQSEKDPLYQRRKLRQKMRDPKSYDDKNSSDESQTATTPRSYRKKSYMEERSSRALWRKQDQLFTRNIRMYQTEIIPLESDRDHIYYKRHECCCVCRCEKRNSLADNIKVDILKIEQISPRDHTVQYRAELVEGSEKLPDCNADSSNEDVLDKISSLRNDLVKTQEQWENCPATPNL